MDDNKIVSLLAAIIGLVIAGCVIYGIAGAQHRRQISETHYESVGSQR